MVPIAEGVQLRPRAPILRGDFLHALRILWQTPNYRHVIACTASFFYSCLLFLLATVAIYLFDDQDNTEW